MADTSPHAPLDPATPWDPASLANVATAALVGQPTASLAVQLGHAIGRLATIRELHRPVNVYQPDPGQEGEAWLTASIAHQVCAICCIAEGYQTEACTDHHDHGPGKPICPTAAVLEVDLDGTGGEGA